MTKEEVSAKVLAVLTNLGHAAKPSMNLKTDLDMDSLDLVEFAMNLEKEFNIVITDSQVDEMATVEMAIDTVFENVSTISNV
jgi:acyl carrier protein